MAFAVATFASASSAAVFDFEVVAYTGGPVPGVPDAVFAPMAPFAPLLGSYPTLSARGSVAFRARLAIGPGGVTSNDDFGIWGPGADGALTLLAREGHVLPGTPSTLCASLYPSHPVTLGLLLLNAHDQAMFGCRLRPAGSTVGGLLGIAGPRGGTAPQLVALVDTLLPGAPSPYQSAVLYYLEAPVFDDFGRISFLGGVTPPTLNGLWRTDGQGAAEPVVWEGQPSPGIAGPNARFQTLGAPSTSRNGDLAFSATATGGNSWEPSSEGIWVADGAGGWRLVVRTSEAAAGVPGATYQDLDRPDVNAQRQTAFGVRLGPLAECDTLGGRCGAVYRGDESGIESLLARTGATVAGAEPGSVFGTSDWEVLINDFGLVAFKGTIFVPTAAGHEEKGAVFGPSGLGVRMLAREGAQAAGLPAGVLYEHLERPLLNLRGEIVFWAQLDPGPINSASGGGIFFADVAGVVQPVLKAGDSIEVGGVAREIAQITSWTQTGNGSRRPFNDTGEFAFAVYLTDGGEAQVVGRVRRPPSGCGLGAEIALFLSALLLRSARATRARTEVASRRA